MKSPQGERLKVAIDSQISTRVAGGTETALMALWAALPLKKRDEDFLLIGLKGHDHELDAFMGPDMTKIVWPNHYRWFTPGMADKNEMGPYWRRLKAALGPFGGIVSFIRDYYAAGAPISPRVTRLASYMGPFGRFMPPLYLLYCGLRYKPMRPMTRRRADGILKDQNVDVVHFPYPLHFETSLPVVYEPWGLPHRHQPECFRPGEGEWMDKLFYHGCQQASMIITATRWVKQDIMKAFNIPSEKIAVIPRLPSFPQEDHPMSSSEALAGLPEKYALFPSMTWASKNHARLIRAIATLRDKHNVSLNLVCTGRTDTAEWEIIQSEIKRLKLENQVKFLGVVPQERLNALFRGAAFLIHPSTFEGLGLPLVEAFHHGAPVVCSTAACMPEVVGDAAIKFDPFDEEAITAALLHACQNPALLDELRRKGAARLLTHFPSSEKTANMFITVYRTAAGAKLSEEQQVLLHEMLA